MTIDVDHLAAQLDHLTQKHFRDMEVMRSVAADLTAEAYLLDALHSMLDHLEPRKVHLAQRIARIVPPSQMAPPIAQDDDTRAFVGRVAQRSQQHEMGSDEQLERIIANLQRNRVAAE